MQNWAFLHVAPFYSIELEKCVHSNFAVTQGWVAGDCSDWGSMSVQ